MSDWFPVGAVASQYYALYKRMPLLPYEELLCKEAMLLYRNLSELDLNDPAPVIDDLLPQQCIKASFVQLMRFQHHTRWLLMRSGACMQSSEFVSEFPRAVLCNLCNRECYLSYVICNCNTQPICLHHGTYCIYSFFILFCPLFHTCVCTCLYAHMWVLHWFADTLMPTSENEIESCNCGCSRIIFMRKDILELEAASQKFEQEDGILDEAKKQAAQMDDLLMLPNLFCYDEKNGYAPYCDVKFEASREIGELVQDHSETVDSVSWAESLKHNTVETAPSSALNLSSSRSIDENSLVHNKVRH